MRSFVPGLTVLLLLPAPSIAASFTQTAQISPDAPDYSRVFFDFSNIDTSLGHINSIFLSGSIAAAPTYSFYYSIIEGPTYSFNTRFDLRIGDTDTYSVVPMIGSVSNNGRTITADTHATLTAFAPQAYVDYTNSGSGFGGQLGFNAVNLYPSFTSANIRLASVTATFDYTPAVPEPASWLLLGLAAFLPLLQRQSARR